MERKQKREIVIAIVVILTLVGVVFWLIRDVSPNQTDPKGNERNLPTTPSTPPATPTYNPDDIPKAQEVSAGTVARTFVERIGSYSSESNYQNVNDVLGLVTTKLAAKLTQDAKRARAQEGTGEGGYYGISTSYLGANTTAETETNITLMVQTQREEAFGSPGNAEIRYQKIEVALVQENGTWKVDDFTWQD